MLHNNTKKGVERIATDIVFLFNKDTFSGFLTLKKTYIEIKLKNIPIALKGYVKILSICPNRDGLLKIKIESPIAERKINILKIITNCKSFFILYFLLPVNYS